MTYFFEWRRKLKLHKCEELPTTNLQLLDPDLEAGSEKEQELTKQHKMRGKMSVDKVSSAHAIWRLPQKSQGR